MVSIPISGYPPLFELRVDHPVGEALTANTDTLEYTVTLQLVHYQVGINDTWK